MLQLTSLRLALLWTLLKVSDAGLAPPTYTREDLLVTFPTTVSNAALIGASRPWRRGVRTHIVVPPGIDTHALSILGDAYRETFTVLPDFPGHPGTVRHALTPIFAADAVRPANFKWMLLGDDDTIWVIPAVLRMLNEAELSADEPHLLSDYHWRCKDAAIAFNCEASYVVDPRCLPCPPGGPPRCPCKLPRGCAQPDPWRFQNCSQLPERVVLYGGAGIIMSVGMLRLLTASPFYVPFAFKNVHQREPWGDRVLSDAPRVLGFGVTQLGDAAAYNSADPDKSCRFFGTFSFPNDERSLEQMLSHLEHVAKHELGLLRRAVSHHARIHLEGAYHGLPREAQLEAYGRIADLFNRIHEEDVTAGVKA